MKIAIILCGIGILVGVIVGEYYPEIFASGFGLAENLSSPYSTFRNNLAIKYALIMGTIGFILGLLITIVLSQTVNDNAVESNFSQKSFDRVNVVSNASVQRNPQVFIIITTIIILLSGIVFWWHVSDVHKPKIVIRYINNKDGTVTDTKTGLMWKKCSEGQNGDDCDGKPTEFNWDSALNISDAINNSGGYKIGNYKIGGGFAGYRDWRLPNIDELKSMFIEEGFSVPYLDKKIFPNPSPLIYWSSSPSRFNDKAAMAVYLKSGSSDWEFSESKGCVRLVRSCENK